MAQPLLSYTLDPAFPPWSLSSQIQDHTLLRSIFQAVSYFRPAVSVSFFQNLHPHSQRPSQTPNPNVLLTPQALLTLLRPCPFPSTPYSHILGTAVLYSGPALIPQALPSHHIPGTALSSYPGHCTLIISRALHSHHIPGLPSYVPDPHISQTLLSHISGPLSHLLPDPPLTYIGPSSHISSQTLLSHISDSALYI
jgi:hypothetical protein